MFGPLGGPELFLILVVALIVFGPRKLPEIGKSLGRMMGEFRRASNEFRRTIEDEVEAEKLREATRIEVPSLSTPAETPPVHAPALSTPAEAPPTPSPEAPSTSPETPPAPPAEASPTPLVEARAGAEPPSDTVSRGDLPAEPK